MTWVINAGSTDVLNLKGNLTNQGIFDSHPSSATAINNVALVMAGTSATPQVISGNGTWTSTLSNCLWQLTINNTGGGVELNTAIAVQTFLNLNAGVLSGTGTLTLGVTAALSGQNPLTTTIAASVTPGTVSPSMNVFYNPTVTYTINYNNTASYTTGERFPPLNSTFPISGPDAGTAGWLGAMNINAGAIVVLGQSGAIPQLTISTTGIFRLNGYTLRLAAPTMVPNASYTALNNLGVTANTSGLDASVPGSRLYFTGYTQQAMQLGNQVFAGVVTKPDLEVANTYAGSSGGAYTNLVASPQNTAYFNNVIVDAGGNFYVYNNGGTAVYVAGNITNNGVLYTDGTVLTEMLWLNGTTQQTISGTGVWALTGTTESWDRKVYRLRH